MDGFLSNIVLLHLNKFVLGITALFDYHSDCVKEEMGVDEMGQK